MGLTDEDKRFIKEVGHNIVYALSDEPAIDLRNYHKLMDMSFPELNEEQEREDL